MNKPLSASDLATPKVTTGPIAGSRKIHAVPEAAPDLRVPLREIALSEGSGEPPLPVYDTSGPYTDDTAGIDVEAGLSGAGAAWGADSGGSAWYPRPPIKTGSTRPTPRAGIGRARFRPRPSRCARATASP